MYSGQMNQQKNGCTVVLTEDDKDHPHRSNNMMQNHMDVEEEGTVTGLLQSLLYVSPPQ